MVLLEVSYCRSLISRLEQIDPRKLSHEEKIAFWLNVHNALVMHVRFLINLEHQCYSFIIDAVNIYFQLMVEYYYFRVGISSLRYPPKQCQENISTLEG